MRDFAIASKMPNGGSKNSSNRCNASWNHPKSDAGTLTPNPAFEHPPSYGWTAEMGGRLMPTFSMPIIIVSADGAC